MVQRKRQFKTIRKVRTLLPKNKRERRKLELFSGATLLVFAAIISALAFAPAFQKIALQSPQTAAVVSAVLTDLLNGDRSANQLGTLTVNEKLVAAAQAKADDMAAQGYFAHTSPGGRDSWYWFKQAGYDFTYAGENLAVDFSESGDVERAWMNSPSHRENILNPHFTEIGIATAVGMYQGRLTVFAVQMFGSGREASASPAEVKVVSAPENPEEIALAQTSTSSPDVLGESATPTQEAIAPAPPKHVAVAPKTKVAVLASNAKAPSAIAATIAEDPAASVAPQPQQQSVGAIRTVPWWGYIVSFPKTSLLYIYILLSLLIAGAFVWMTEWEFHRRHLQHATGAAFLFGLMGILFVMSQYLFFVQPVLAAVQ